MPIPEHTMPLPTFDTQIETTLALLQSAQDCDRALARLVISPYRICPLGAHVDHQGGEMLARPIATGTVLAFVPLETTAVRLTSPRYGQAAFSIGDSPEHEHWFRYAQAAAQALARRQPLRRGLAAAVSGTMIGAGLSSSASVGLAFLQALAAVNDIALSGADLVDLQLVLENELLGLKVGILDPGTIIFGRQGGLLRINARSGLFNLTADPEGCPPFTWLVAYSGTARQLLQTGFNTHVDECRAAAALLLPGATRLGDVPADVFEDRQQVLPETLRRRAWHYYSEIERVHSGAQAWRNGDLERFGALMNASCQSSIVNYESGSPLLIDLQALVSTAPGVYGSRFSGGGYGGCVVALVQQSAAGQAARSIIDRFTRMHPETAGLAEVHPVSPADGLHLVYPDERMEPSA